jgi:hypothetical protein
MTLAGVVARLRDKSDHYLPDWARGAMGEAADLLESQAKALSEWKQAASVEAGLRREFYDRALAAEARLAEAMKVIERDMEALTEADTQIEYLHDKFKPTGSGANAIARIDIALTAARCEGKDMSLILSGDENNVAMPVTDAEVNHLRRLLGWLRCEYNLSEDGQRGMLIGLDRAVKSGASVDRAQAILDSEVAKIRRVPAYIRQAVKMLTRAIRDHDAETRMIEQESKDA